MAEAGGQGEDRPAFSQKRAEIAVAGLFLVAGAIVVVDSVRLGASWGADGPRPGYFPFYVGLVICVSSLINLARAVMVKTDKHFVLAGQLKMVLAVLVPSAIYVAAMTWIGLYVSSALFIAFFMRWLGRYAWWKVAVVSIATMAVFYLVFEIWFKVPLPKGPLESLLGLG